MYIYLHRNILYMCVHIYIHTHICTYPTWKYIVIIEYKTERISKIVTRD